MYAKGTPLKSLSGSKTKKNIQRNNKKHSGKSIYVLIAGSVIVGGAIASCMDNSKVINNYASTIKNFKVVAQTLTDFIVIPKLFTILPCLK
jgi:hypothetical protein